MKNIKMYLFVTSIGILGLNGCTPALNQQLNPTVTELNKAQKTATNTLQSNVDQVKTNYTLATTGYEAPTESKLDKYAKTMQKVASGIQNDTAYNRIALDTPEKKAWFKTLTYRLWDRQITRQQFLAQGLAKYPSHQHEFEFIINGFAKNCN